MLWFRQLQFICGNSFWLFLLRTHRTWHTHDFNCSWVVSWAPILQMPIYYLFPELAIRREGSGNSTEISTDSLVQADMAGSSSSRRKKKTRQGKCFHVFKLRKQGGTVIFSVKQVDRYKLSLSVGVSQSCKTEVCQKLLFEELCAGNEMSDSLPLTFPWLCWSLLYCYFIICHIPLRRFSEMHQQKQGGTII